MNLHFLDGLTPRQLHDKILESPVGFSVEGDGIQYLGREIQLKDGKAILSESEQNRSQPESKEMLDRLVSFEPGLRGQLASSRAEALQQAAEKMVKTWGWHAVKESPTQELKYAAALEYTGSEVDKIYHIMPDLDSFSPLEKYQLLSIVQNKTSALIDCAICLSLDIDAVYRFELIKEAIQFPEGCPFEYDSGRTDSDVMEFEKEKTLSSGLSLMRQLLKREDNALATRLMPEVDNLEKRFSGLVNSDGKFDFSDRMAFKDYGNNLLYLVAACSGASDQADIDELVSYITSVLRDNDRGSIRHIARELAFLAKQPGSVGYSRYVDAVAAILTDRSFTVTQYGNLQQLADIRGFGLLEGSKPLTAYLAALKKLVESLPPECSSVLLSEIAAIERRFADKKQPDEPFPAADRQEIKGRVHHLLLIVACTLDICTENDSALAPFVKAVVTHGRKSNIPYLVSGLACLAHSALEKQRFLRHSAPHGGAQCLLATPGLLRLLDNAKIISRDDLEVICKQLQANTASRSKMKDGKVFHQWLVTLDHIQVYIAPGKTNMGQVLRTLTLDMSTIYEKLGILDMIALAKKQGGQALKPLGLEEYQEEEALLLIAEKGLSGISQDRQPASQWLLKQRYSHLLPVYLQKIMAADQYTISPKNKTKLIRLIDQFLESSGSNTFIEARQSPSENPHLQAVYQKRPEFLAGWGRNFKGFSQNISGRLGAGEVLLLTEDPWDLFISGLAMQTCQSPDHNVVYSRALMSYVMDGRNAMIVKKNTRNILGRAVIRIIFDQSANPALFIEQVYPKTKIDEKALFIDAALEIAHQMRLPLYKAGSPEETREELTMLAGRAPFDYFDSANGICPRRDKVVIHGVEVKPAQGLTGNTEES